MKQLLFSLVFFSAGLASFSQRISGDDQRGLQQREDSMKQYAVKLIQGKTAEERFTADSIFTKMFVRALVTRNSFFYPFDSLQTISKLYAPDSSFRIYTWQMVVNENLVRQHGAIQLRTPDGSLKLFPLIDKSDVTVNISDTFANNRGWIGAVYYKIIETRDGKQPYYTLLGYDENNIRSSRKIIDILHFSEGEPQFGGPFFSFEEDSASRRPVARYIMEYKKDAGPRLAWDDDLGMVIFEHLESETNEPAKKWTLIPDGDYEAFKWKNGKWVHINKVFNQVTPEGHAPVPEPIKDAEGNTDEEKLQNNRNGGQDSPARPAAKKPNTVAPSAKKKTQH